MVGFFFGSNFFYVFALRSDFCERVRRYALPALSNRRDDRGYGRRNYVLFRLFYALRLRRNVEMNRGMSVFGRRVVVAGVYDEGRAVRRIENRDLVQFDFGGFHALRRQPDFVGGAVAHFAVLIQVMRPRLAVAVKLYQRLGLFAAERGFRKIRRAYYHPRIAIAVFKQIQFGVRYPLAENAKTRLPASDPFKYEGVSLVGEILYGGAGVFDCDFLKSENVLQAV